MTQPMVQVRKLVGLWAIAIGLASATAGASLTDTPRFKAIGIVVVWAADDSGSAPIVTDLVIDTAAGAADTDLISGDAHTVVTGTLTSTFDSAGSADVPSRPFNVRNAAIGGGSTDSNGNGQTDAGDSFSSFTLGGSTRVGLDDAASYTSFYVASNVPFNIEGQAVRVIGRDDWVLGKIFWDMQVTPSGNDGLAFGSAAQFPHSAGASGGVQPVPSLFDMMTPQTVFSGNQRTAASNGNLADQSVRFDVTYTLGSWSGYSLSHGAHLQDGVYIVEAEVTYTVWVP
ncbi:MAG: hypothetical protein AAFR00_05370 [Pseudomonadota bacterium]